MTYAELIKLIMRATDNHPERFNIHMRDDNEGEWEIETVEEEEGKITIRIV